GGLGLIPTEAALGLAMLPVGPQVRLDLVELPTCVLRAAFPPLLVRGQVVFVAVAALVVRPSLVVLRPVAALRGRIDVFGDGFADGAATHRAGHRADDTTDDGPDGSTGGRPDRRPRPGCRHTATRPTYAAAYGVPPGRPG